jgi:DNA uptake protein ComE-like DNA-binding protein
MKTRSQNLQSRALVEHYVEIRPSRLSVRRSAGQSVGRRSSYRGERASVLVIVLWITFGLVSLALYFAQSANFEFRAADNRVAALEAEQAIEGAARYVSNVLSAVLLQTNLPPALPDPLSYQQAAVPIGDALFWIIGRNTNNLQTGPITPAFGLVDESGKLNLNTATLDMLQWLPRMTPDLAANIVSWRQSSNSTASASSGSSSSSSSSSSYGVTPDAYSQLTAAYLCKSAPYETVDELRLVFGLTPDLLYGEDMNLNGILDANENDGDLTPPSDDANGLLDPGLFEYVTVWSQEPSTASDGSQRINVTNVTQLTTLLQQKFNDSRAAQILQGAGLAAAATGARGGGQGTGGAGSGRGGTTGTGGGSTTGAGGSRGGGASGGTGGNGGTVVAVAVPTFGSLLEFYLKSGMTEDEFAQIADNITTTNSTNVTGLVNINTASQAVLSCIPGIGSNTAPAVVSYRLSNAANLTSVAWVANVLDSNSAIQAGPYITARSYQFSADIAAVGHYGRGFRRVKFIFDISQGVPKIIYRQDLTHLGWALGKEVRDKLLLANINKR